jgi:hypothetical protein
MPPLIVYEGADGVLVIYNGVTRAPRVAKLAPGTLVRVEVIGRLRRAFGADPKIGDPLAMIPSTQREALAVIGGFSIIEVASREEALAWAGRIAKACRCAQEVRGIMFDPES